MQTASKSRLPCLQGHLEILLEWLQRSEGAPKTFFRLHFLQTAIYATPTLKGSASLIVVCNAHLLINMFSYWLALQPEWQVSINLGLSIKKITFWCIYLHLMILIILIILPRCAHTHTQKSFFSFILRSVLLSHLLPSLPLHLLLYSIIQNVQNKTWREGLIPSTLPLSNLFPSYWPFSLYFIQMITAANKYDPNRKQQFRLGGPVPSSVQHVQANQETANFENAFLN